MIGQCTKIIHLMKPFTTFGMSTKRIFDDSYLYLKEVNHTHLKNQNVAFDPMNDLPAQSYYEISSQFWNLIYKQPLSASLMQKSVEIQINCSEETNEFDQSTENLAGSPK